VHGRAEMTPDETGDRAAHELSALAERLREKDARRRRLVADLGHDLKTPLAVVLAHARRALADPALADRQRVELESIATAASDLAGQIEELLSAARLEERGLELRLGDVDLARLVRDVAGGLQALAHERGVRLAVTVPASLAVRVDHRRMASVVANLAANAVRHAVERVQVTLGARDGRVVLTVADDGPGVPVELREAVFERFRQGEDAPGTGSGLGLAIVREAVELHSGTVTIASAPEGGALFTVVLPVEPARRPVAVDVSATTERAIARVRADVPAALAPDPFEHAPVGMGVVGLDGCWRRANRALCALLGRTPGGLIGRPVAEVLHKRDVDADKHLLRRTMDGAIGGYEIEKRIIHPETGELWTLWSAALAGAGEASSLIVHVQDVDERKRSEGELRRLVEHDRLTGVVVRSRFEVELGRELTRARRYGEAAALIVVDVDGLGAVNAAHGLRAGDRLLTAVARAVDERLRGSDTLARLGDDEFGALLVHVTPEEAAQVADDLRAAVGRARVRGRGGSVTTTASIGVVMLDDGATAESALVAATAAVRAAKERGGDRVTADRA
jgi:diguanylate cyclase (GGDEF)-like protein/PAS domain S-box-containing protein